MKTFELDVGGQETTLAPRRGKAKQRSEPGGPWQYLGRMGEIGFAIAIPIAGGALVGVFIDRRFGSTPVATLSLLFFGIIASFMSLFTIVKTIIQERG